MDKKELKSRPILKLKPRRHKTLLDKPIPLIDVPILKPIPYKKIK